MKTKINFEKIENIVRSIYVSIVLLGIPVLSYLTATHKEQAPVKEPMAFHAKQPISKNPNS